MNNQILSSQYYGHQPPAVDGSAAFYQGFSDDTTVYSSVLDGTGFSTFPDHETTTLTNGDFQNDVLYSNISNVESSILGPLVTNTPGKQKRRRSKGAIHQANAATTFLNASITNFRALVQQHTGCHSTNIIEASNSNINPSSNVKGPITLCFSSSSPIHQEPSNPQPDHDWKRYN